jgi:hypothetical protein
MHPLGVARRWRERIDHNGMDSGSDRSNDFVAETPEFFLATLVPRRDQFDDGDDTFEQFVSNRDPFVFCNSSHDQSIMLFRQSFVDRPDASDHPVQ